MANSEEEEEEKKGRTPGYYQKAPQPKHIKLRLLRATRLKMIIINCATLALAFSSREKERKPKQTIKTPSQFGARFLELARFHNQ